MSLGSRRHELTNLEKILSAQANIAEQQRSIPAPSYTTSGKKSKSRKSKESSRGHSASLPNRVLHRGKQAVGICAVGAVGITLWQLHSEAANLCTDKVPYCSSLPFLAGSMTTIDVPNSPVIATHGQFPNIYKRNAKVSKAVSFTIEKMTFNKDTNTIGYKVGMTPDKAKFALMVPKDKADPSGKTLAVDLDKYKAANYFSDYYKAGIKSPTVKKWCTEDLQQIVATGNKLTPALQALSSKSHGVLAPTTLGAIDNSYTFKPAGKSVDNPHEPNAYVYTNDPKRGVICGPVAPAK